MPEDGEVVHGWIAVQYGADVKPIYKPVPCPVPIVRDGHAYACDGKAFLFVGLLGICSVHGIGVLAPRGIPREDA